MREFSCVAPYLLRRELAAVVERAKEEAKNPAERRVLLAAGARLESEYVDEFTVLGIRFRMRRAVR
ncbi:DUF5954 family protein [Streptomyces sp. NPDC087219]|uniref:DUF5954 family protein n=1 Tax=Streptomyces sp. NPDC087219 TaxID=3365770 RepID=UPI00380A026F